MESKKADFLQIEFIVIGGSACGLAAGIALARAGHKVTLLEKKDLYAETNSTGCRIPPNSTKMYYRWGLEDRLKKCAIKSQGMMFASYSSGAVVASHEWEEDMMQETGGDFLLIDHADLHRILADGAQESGVELRYGKDNKVVSVNLDGVQPSVTLTNGEVLYADVLIGADGNQLEECETRKAVREAIGQEAESTDTHMVVYTAVIRVADVDPGPDKELLAHIRTSGKMFTWFGGFDYGALVFPAAPETGEALLTLSLYTPHDRKEQERRGVELDKDGVERHPSTERLLEVIKDADPRLRNLAKYVGRITCVAIKEYPSLAEWVHPDGRLLCIGEAAHPTPIGSPYSFGMSTGDAAVLGRLFSHLHREEQIDEFLNAVQEIRQARVEHVLEACVGNIFAVSLPPGLAEHHDRTLLERTEQEMQSLRKRRAQTSEEMMETIEMIFGYDPEDEADDWWVGWGLMHERAAKWAIVDQPFAFVIEESRQEQVVYVEC